MEKLRTVSRLLIVMLTFIIIPSVQVMAVDLSFSPPQNSTFEIQIKTEQTIVQDLIRKNKTLNDTSIYDFRYHLQNKNNNGDYPVIITLNRIRKKMRSGRRRQEIDSARGPSQVPSPTGALFTSLNGETFTAVISPAGNIKFIQGINEIISGAVGAVKQFYKEEKGKMITKMGKNNPDMDKKKIHKMAESTYQHMLKATDKMKQNIQTMVGKKTWEQMLQQLHMIHSGQSKEVEEKWKKTTTLTNPVPLLVENTYILKNVGPKFIIVSGSGTIKPDLDAPPLPVNYSSLTMRYLVKGDQKSTIRFNKETNFISTAKITQDLHGNIKWENGRDRGTVDIESTTTIKTTRIK